MAGRRTKREKDGGRGGGEGPPPAGAGAPGASARAGFSLLEVAAAIVVLTIAFAGLGAFLTSMSGQREQLETRTLVLSEAQNVMEEILGTEPAAVQEAFHGTTWTVKDVAGNFQDGAALSVSVQYVEDHLVEATVSGSWSLRGRSESLKLTTQIYDDE